jgi:hypothetical protein
VGLPAVVGNPGIPEDRSQKEAEWLKGESAAEHWHQTPDA